MAGRIRALLTQPQYQPLRQAVQVAELLALSEGVLDSLPLDRIATFKARLPSWLDARVPAALNRIEKTGELDEDSRSALLGALRDLAATLAPSAADAEDGARSMP